jgi:hypothetical protein
MVCSVQTVLLSCTDTNIVSKWTKTRFHTTHVTYEFHKVRRKLFMSLRYVWRKPCTNLASRVALSPNVPNRASIWASWPKSTFKMISMPMVRSVQTVLLSCTDTNTVYKWTKMRFHTTHITYEFHRVPSKLFMSLWYVQCKPCTYLTSRLALPDPRHLGVPSGASKTVYEPMAHLTETEHLSCIYANTMSKHIETGLPMTHVT